MGENYKKHFMNSNWRNRPTTIDYVSKGITWVVAIDESGSPDLRRIKKPSKKVMSSVKVINNLRLQLAL